MGGLIDAVSGGHDILAIRILSILAFISKILTTVKKYLLLLLLIAPVMAFSQKVPDLDKFKFSSQFRSLPVARLDTSYHTYNVNVTSTRLMQAYLDNMTPEKSVLLEGWKWLPSNGHITIDVKLDDLLPEAVSLKEREEVTKDKNGVEIARKKIYWQEVTYTFSALADINDYKGAHVETVVLADRGYKQIFKSPEFANRVVAEGYFLVNTLSVTERLYKNCVNRAMNYLSSRVSEDFGFGERTVTDFMWIIDSKKHPEYQAHRQAFLQVSEVLFGLTANQTLEGVREKLAPAIAYFESIKRKYPSTSKHDRKIRYASYYNLAKLYWYLDDPQSMIREASGLIMNDFDSKDGKSLEASAMQLKNLFSQTNFTSRHFPLDVNSFRGPNETSPVAIK